MKSTIHAAAASAVATIALLGMAGTGPAHAAQVAGDNAIELSGGFFHANGTDSGTLNLDVSYARFFTPEVEAGLRQTLNYAFVDDREDPWTASTIPYVNYHIRGLTTEDRFQPYIGGFLGAAYNDNDTTFTIGPNVGFKYFVGEQTFIDTRYRYEWFADDLSIGQFEDNRASGNHVVTIGIGYVWGGLR